jgi:outer membrane protein
MKKIVWAVAAGMTLLGNPVLAQEFKEGDWLVRARAVHLDAANSNSNASVPVSINNKWLPELDVSYFFTSNLAAELILTVPQKHRVSLGASQIGTLKHLPPTLTLQYHFDMGGFKPYVGAGINYTRFSDVSLPAGVSLDSHSWGWAFQAGLDIPLDRNWSINLDVKKAYIRSDIYAAGSSIGRLRVDPILYAVGLGYRF